MATLGAVGQSRRRVWLYGCGAVAPGAANVKELLANVESQTCALTPLASLNNAFLVGMPKFDFSIYQDWIAKRFNQTKFSQLEKLTDHVKLGVGTTIDALDSNPGVEEALKKIDSRVIVAFGSGFGDVGSYFKGHDDYLASARVWNYFWAQPSHNAAAKKYLESGAPAAEGVPPRPTEFAPDSPERERAAAKWDAYWAPQSDELKKFVGEFSKIESMTIGDDVATDKLSVIRTKAKARKALMDRYGCPVPPWESVSSGFLWNLPNGPAAQITMLLGTHGVSYAANGACSTYGMLVRHALDAIQSNTYDAAIIGTTDLPPDPTVVSSFHNAKVLAAGNDVGIPLCGLRGTHVSGGSCVWILAEQDTMEKLGVKPLHQIEILSAGLASDAEHIITPSLEGPKNAIRTAFKEANVMPADIDTWDMHATGTPGDWSEFKLMEDFVPPSAVVTARKGIFGHGMGTCGGWEMTVQLLGTKKQGDMYVISPSGIPQNMMHSTIKTLSRNIATDKPVTIKARPQGFTCGKLSMGIGGITACVIARIHL